MKKLTFLMAALLVAMTGCQKEPQVSDETQDGAEVYMSFSVEAVTKSATDKTGESNSDATPETEVGKDEENKISDVQVFLQKDASIIKASSVLVGGDVNYTATFREDELTAGTYSVYVICNDSAPIEVTGFSTDLKKAITVNGQDLNISEDNKFLMTNAKGALETTITDEQLKSCMNPATPLNLGLVEVERTVARFDYASTATGDLYSITGNDNVKILLEQAAVINVSTGSYYFRRVAADANEGTATVLGGQETKTNYVVDTDWSEKKGLFVTWAAADAAYLFNYRLEDTKTNWSWVNLTTLGDADNITGNINDKDREYNFLSYVSENTIPGINEQINGLSTGVVFRGYLHNGTNKLNNLGNLYVYANKYYGQWTDVATAAADGSDAALTAAYNAVNGNQTDLAKCVEAGFTVYTQDGAGNYPVYYYYWNRHNDNSKPSEMGIMEYAVVRNNVYKLAVTKLNQFGHPEDPTGDPDPVNPSTPDEQVRHYFQVSVKILPWTVRVNDIEF